MVSSRKVNTASTVDAEVVEEVQQRVAEVMRVKTFNDETLGAIDSWDKALAMANVAYGQVDNVADVIGNGFRIIRDDETKTKLIGAPLLLLEWQRNVGDFNDFASIYVVQRHDDGGMSKFVLNVGEAILKQLDEFEENTGRNGGMLVPKGLRRSDFYFDGDKNSPNYGHALTKREVAEYITEGKKPQPATTWYLDTSA